MNSLHPGGHSDSDDSLKLSSETRELKLKYELKGILGSGTSSVVYKARDRQMKRDFAVKVVDITGEHGDAMAEQVKTETLREIAILSLCLGQPNIIQLREYFQTPTALFVIVELCKNGELFDYLTQMISLNERRVRVLMRQILGAVSFIHANNIVHRDLKAENILLDDNFNIKISDFGFSVILEEGQKLSDLCGTPSYLAPEVLVRSMYEDAPGYGKEVDIWACGVIMFTLLCGQPPFWNRRQMVMLRAIMNGDYYFNNPEWEAVTQDAKNLIRQMLVVDPHLRLTAEDALEHPFFISEYGLLSRRREFLSSTDIALKRLYLQKVNKFRVGVYCVLFIIWNYHPIRHALFNINILRLDPYSIKSIRKSIDAAAFSTYRHWVKRDAIQNRAALFENELRYPRQEYIIQE